MQRNMVGWKRLGRHRRDGRRSGMMPTKPKCLTNQPPRTTPTGCLPRYLALDGRGGFFMYAVRECAPMVSEGEACE